MTSDVLRKILAAGAAAAALQDAKTRLIALPSGVRIYKYDGRIVISWP